MLRSTFCHLPGIGLRTESSLHKSGLYTWNDFLHSDRVKGFGVERKRLLDAALRRSQSALLDADHQFFSERLPSPEHYRAYPDFQEDAVFLDLESDARGITVLTAFDGFETKVLVRGANLHMQTLKKILEAPLLVTFNGGSYDLPKIRQEFGLRTKFLHVDIKTLAHRMGFHGGLKAIEEQLGVRRDLHVRGGEPALLFRMWRASGDEHYLNLLLDYNADDVINLYFVTRKLFGLIVDASSS